ncbi:hypothetical protein DM02DRAFT_655798 [Periconia macrospinosa]|uniref:Uncharacterized protein n=1 Tax=Periconia macrospinosa TaxID=97972 RepID=A0A2V1DRV2_9PLEO|nr:hypothetical protein DM02DRAFT_655798 [Periconia macrospinosa]
MTFSGFPFDLFPRLHLHLLVSILRTGQSTFLLSNISNPGLLGGAQPASNHLAIVTQAPSTQKNCSQQQTTISTTIKLPSRERSHFLLIMADPRRTSLSKPEYRSRNQMPGDRNESRGAAGHDENGYPHSSMSATQSRTANSQHSPSKPPQEQPGQLRTANRHHNGGFPKSAALDQLKDIPRHKPPARPTFTALDKDPTRYHSGGFPKSSLLSHLPDTLPPLPIPDPDPSSGSSPMRARLNPTFSPRAIAPKRIEPKRPSIDQPYHFDPVEATQPPYTTDPIRNEVRNPAGDQAYYFHPIKFNRLPSTDLIRDEVPPDPFDCSAHAQIIRFAQSPDGINIPYRWSLHTLFLESNLQSDLISCINNMLQPKRSEYVAPLLRDMVLVDEDGFGGEALFYSEQVVFAQTGMQREIDWRFLRRHMDLLDKLDFGKSEFGLEELDWLEKEVYDEELMEEGSELEEEYTA